MRGPRDVTQYLEDMLEAAEKALSYTSGMDRDGFLEDEYAVLVVSRLLEIVGEAAKNIPDAVRTAPPRSPGGRSPGPVIS